MTQHRTPTHRRIAAFSTAMAVGAGLALTSAATPAFAAIPAPDLHYSMDDIAGTTVTDSSGNGWNGTISGSTAIVAADSGSALDLTGGHVVIPRQVLADSTDLTISTRVRWDGGGPWQWLFGLGSNTSRYLFTTPSNGDGNLRTAVTRNGGGSESTITGGGPLARGQWVDLAVTLDTTADRLITYIGGVAVSSAATDVSAGELLTASATNAGYIGRSFYPDPAFDGAIDDFQIFRSSLTAEQLVELTGTDAPTLDSVTTSNLELRTRVGDAPPLPASVRGEYSDGYDRDVPVTWAAVSPEQYAQSGVFTVIGDAGGFPITARVTVHRGEVRVDMGTDTGDVYGGASGVLYGLYGEGMPSDNLVEGMKLRTVATKAQDGSQHPGSDALEVLPTMTSVDGDVYLRITDWYRGFPYQWPGDTPAAKLADYRKVLDQQLAMIETIPAEQRAHLVIEPFNEPEGNMFGTGQWSLDRTSWLDDPTDYFAAWDATYNRIREVFPDMRIAGPGTSVLFNQVEGFLEHTLEAGTVPDIITWHELSDPATIRTSVAKYRGWEAAVFEGTSFAGTELPININEYAFNYHTSVPGQMIQWISAIEETKVDAMIAFWNINGNLSDSAVQSDRGNGQWWLYNAYAQMSGHTVELTPPSPGENYTLQGVSSLDEDKRIARTIIGGADGAAPVDLVNIPSDVFGATARVQVREIPWTGQLGDSAQPTVLSDEILNISSGSASIGFGSGTLPGLTESSAYEIIVTPGDGAEATAAGPAWKASYEAEAAAFTGSGYSKNGPEGSPRDVSKFYTSGGYDVGGLRTGTDGRLSFTVDVPEDGSYDLEVFANSLNTFPAVAENGPTNVFLTVDGAAEQELFLPLAYKWVVWDHSDTTVDLTAGQHTITLATTSTTGGGTTTGDAIVDRITLERTAPADAFTDYEAEYADHTGTVDGAAVSLAQDQSATFWVYSEKDAEATLEVLGSGSGTVSVNEAEVLDLDSSTRAAAHMRGGVNKVVVDGAAQLDRIRVSPSEERLVSTDYQAEDAALAGSAIVADLALAEGGSAVDGIGGAPGNENTLTFDVDAEAAGKHAVVVRFSNPEQTPATHYNPNPQARRADISVNGGADRPVLFVPTFHQNNFWERTLVLDLKEGQNTIRFSSEKQPNFDGVTYAEQNWPGIPLRADSAPIIDRISVSPLSAEILAETPDEVAPAVVVSADPAEPTGSNGWYRSAVRLTFAAEDEVDPAPLVEVSVDGGEFAPVTGALTIDADGTYAVVARATDAAGNVSETVEWTGRIDRIAPIVAATGAGSRLTLRATDGTSGVDTVRYRYQVKVGPFTLSGAWNEYRTPIAVPSTRYIEVQYYATDDAGNKSSTRSFRR